MWVVCVLEQTRLRGRLSQEDVSVLCAIPSFCTRMNGAGDAIGSKAFVHHAAQLVRAVWESEALARGDWCPPAAGASGGTAGLERAASCFSRAYSGSARGRWRAGAEQSGLFVRVEPLMLCADDVYPFRADSTCATLSRATSVEEQASVHSAASAGDAHLRDWTGVQAKLDPRSSGKVEIDQWLDLVTFVVFGPPAPSRAASGESDRASERAIFGDWESVVLYVWFALDRREAGEVQTNSFIAWLRRLAAAPEEDMVSVSDVYLGIDRGWKTMRSNSAMPQSYLTRLTKVSASHALHSSEDDTADGDASAKSEELESIPTTWAAFQQAESEAPIWTVTQVRGPDGKVVAGPFKSYGRHRKLTVETTSAKDRDWWVGPSRLTDHTHIANRQFPHDAQGIFDRGYRGLVDDDQSMLTGTPVSEPDGFKTVACLHFCTTAKEADAAHGRRRTSPTEIIDISCVLVNRNTWHIVDEFHSYVNPQHTHSFSRLFYATTAADSQEVKAQDGFRDVWEKFERWLVSRNVLDKGKKRHEGNPTVFVVEGSDQLAADLPFQLQLAGQALPVYLDDWLNLNSVFKRHFRCGACSGCSTRMIGACKTRFSVEQMVKVLRSEHWAEFQDLYKTKLRSDTLIDLHVYGVEGGCFDSAHDPVHKEYASKDDEQLIEIRGHLYMFTQDYSGENSLTDSIVQWRLRFFKSNGVELSFACEPNDVGKSWLFPCCDACEKVVEMGMAREAPTVDWRLFI